MCFPGDPEVLCIGCAGVGKTLLVKQLKRLCSASAQSGDAVNVETEPTVGVELDRIRSDGVSCVIREVGAAMMPTWPSYFRSAATVMVRHPSDVCVFVCLRVCVACDEDMSSRTSSLCRRLLAGSL